MKNNLNLIDYEIVFFEDSDNRNQVGIPLEGDYFELSKSDKDISVEIKENNLFIKSEDKMISLKSLSFDLIEKIKSYPVFHILLVDKDLLKVCKFNYAN